MTNNWSWDDMLADFRALGGTAENVRLGHGAVGRGLFVCDPAKPVRINVPQNLLVSSEDVECQEGALRLKARRTRLSPEEDFFERYQNAFSWGAGGREDAEAFIQMMETIPTKISEQITKEFGRSTMTFLKVKDAPLRRFLTSRRLGMANGRTVLMPVLELVNHDANGSPFTFQDGISLTGQFSDEVFAHYNMSDPFGSFFTWGFPGSPSYAFSLPMRLSSGAKQIVIRRNLKEKKRLANVRIPVVSSSANTITFSHLMIGNARNPRVVRGVFRRLLRPFDLRNVDEIFDRIRAANNKRFLSLLRSLSEFDGPSVSAFRDMALNQLEAISNCYGTATPAGRSGAA